MMDFTVRPMLLFDLDGTLWDSAENVALAWNRVFSEADPSLPPLTAEDVHAVMGLTMAEIGRILHPGLSGALREKAFEKCQRYELEYLREHGGRLYPDLRRTLEALKDAGFPLAIVSNCQLGYIDAFLHSSSLGDLFTDLEEWERTGLPKGENIRLVMQRNGAEKGIYIGDTRKDEEAAELAGIPFIHAAYGFGNAAHPAAVIHSLPELPGALRSLSLL